jgi:peptidyl-prolyl cis-trans isomerase A (cyclophilin A)
MNRHRVRPVAVLFLVATAANTLAAQAGRGAATAPARPTPVPATAALRRATLLDPSRAFWRSKAPPTFQAIVETSKGNLTLEITREWAPNGVDRFYNLARIGYFDDSRFFRVIYGFVAQFGIAGNPAVATLWGTRRIAADSVRGQNVRGTITFAQFSPADRTTNLFVNLRDNLKLDTLGFAPIGRVVEGMEVADSLHSGYGELPSMDAPLGDPKRLYGESNKYLDEKFPKLDRIVKITVVDPAPSRTPPASSPTSIEPDRRRRR